MEHEKTGTVKIAPSFLTADAGRLADEVRAVEAAGADYLHLDVMDGRFVPPITFGALVIAAVRKVSRLPLDVHLMIERPERHLEAFAEAGADILNVHVEACTHLHRTLQQIKGLGKPPDQVMSQEVFAWAHGRGLSGNEPALRASLSRVVLN